MTILGSGLHGFSGTVLRPGDPDYDSARRIWNGAIDRRPAFIARCESEADVATAVRFGVRHGLEIAVRGGGHSIPGLSTCEGGLVIDLSPMKAIEVDLEEGLVNVGPGVVWRELDVACEEHGVAVPGGEVSDTGVAGLTLGGGVGWLSRLYGLSCDNLLACRLVTASSEQAHVDVESEPELMWGLRGGGGNFGIVTRFTFRLNRIPTPMYGGMAMYPIEHGYPALDAFLSLAAAAPDALGLNAALVTPPPAPFVPPELQGKPAVALAAGYVGSLSDGEELIRPLQTVTTPAVDMFGPMPYTALQSMIDEAVPAGLPAHARSEWLGPLDMNGAAKLLEALQSMTSPMSQVLLRVMGGAVARVPGDATAFRFRTASHMVTIAALWPDHDDPGDAHREWCRDSWSALQPWSAGGGYVNHLVDEGADRIKQAYGQETWVRLVALKRRWDPDNVFHLNQNIPPR